MLRFQERLKIRRNKQGLSQGELSDKSGVATRLITAIETGEAMKGDKSITLSTVQALAKALGVNPLWLLGSDRMDGNELLLSEEGKTDHTAEALQKLLDAENNIDAAKRLLMPQRGSTNYREKLSISEGAKELTGRAASSADLAEGERKLQERLKGLAKKPPGDRQP